MIRLLGVFLVALTTLAFAQGAKPGRIVGHVDIGPLSPVERPGVKQKVPPEMYKHYRIVITQRGPHNEHMTSHMIRIVKDVPIGGNGDFSADLLPGEYQVGIKGDQQSRRLPDPQTVMIKAGKTIRITFKIDTGIR